MNLNVKFYGCFSLFFKEKFNMGDTVLQVKKLKQKNHQDQFKKHIFDIFQYLSETQLRTDIMKLFWS